VGYKLVCKGRETRGENGAQINNTATTTPKRKNRKGIGRI